MKPVFFTLLLSILSLGATAPSNSDPWLTDYEEAFIKAKREDKYVLINFTGSDWCGWCKRLDREVFSQPQFQAYADKKLVLLKLDYPRRTPQPQEVKVRNQKLAQEFAVRGFPTILIARANQQVVLRTGYQYGGVENYIAHIEKALK